LLDSCPPNLDEIKAIAADIKSNDQRGSEIPRRMRAVLKKGPSRLTIDLNEAVGEVLQLLAAEARAQDPESPGFKSGAAPLRGADRKALPPRDCCSTIDRSDCGEGTSRVPVDLRNAAPDPFLRAQFAMTYLVRRAQGDALRALGLNPEECPYRVVASGPYWRLRDYAGHHMSPSLLIVAAPIKRAYIWDLAPPVSAISYLLGEGLRAYLLEWMPADVGTCNHALDEYTGAVSECVAKVAGEAQDTRPLLIGHSLGGTLAAILGALARERLRGLILLGAPLCFQPETSRFRDGLVSLVPPILSEDAPVPGSLLSHASALAAPGTFIWSRLVDAIASIGDHHALEIHARVERWALDEVALPGRLMHQIVEWLYCENRFCRGVLTVRNTLVGPLSLTVPMLTVVNVADEVTPLSSVTPFIEAMPGADVGVIEYSGEVGVVLQHLGILVGHEARGSVWPAIMSWIKTRN
jgi:polyhydroxyalkanoate synthase